MNTKPKNIRVVAALIRQGGRVLLTQRKPGRHLGLSWEFPGGKIEFEEDAEEGLRRELREELGMSVLSVAEPLFVIDDPGSHFVIAFHPTTASGEPRPIEHHYAGLVRLEVRVGLGVSKAAELLDQAAVKVAAVASRAPKDPRAPQNLIPVGGLERQLRHKLGDPKLVRRGIERELLDRRNREE